LRGADRILAKAVKESKGLADAMAEDGETMPAA